MLQYFYSVTIKSKESNRRGLIISAFDAAQPETTMPRILLSHGAGGREMLDLIEQVFRRHSSPAEVSQDDSAILTLEAVNLAFTTDAFVVSPFFSPAAISAGWPWRAR